MVQIRADVPERYAVLYNSCISEEGRVDVEKFIDGLDGVDFKKVPITQGISGILVMSDEREFSILVNQDEPPERQRFTAAHELGHYFLHRNLLRVGTEIKDRYILKAEGVSDENEEEANQFAAAFLMPLDKVGEAMNSGKTNVESLAKHFDVSVIAMANRLQIPT